ncbi:MAG: diacylglycerol kinase family protein [Patescibacteria group bacterium]|jgi:diacylglycerol kinase
MKRFDFKKFIRSFHYAFRGVIRLLLTEQNARIHLTLTIVAGILAYLFGITRVEAAILFIAVIMVFAMEIINTSFEKLCDLIDQNHNPIIARVKDGMAGAVLIASVIAAVVAFIIFVPYLRDIVH